MTYFTALLLPLFSTISLTPCIIRICKRAKIFDVPDARKVHTQPVPRIGGIVIAISVFIPLIILWTSQDIFLRGYIIGSAIIVLFGFFDDLKNLGYKIKFSGQISAAVITVLVGQVQISNLGNLFPDAFIIPPWASIPLTILLIVGVTNAVNFADGLDGLAGGICLISFCCIAYLAFIEGNTTITLLSLSLVGAIFGFLRFNTFPASLFMGDTGSQFLGFSLVTTSLALTQGQTALSPILPLIIFGFPVLDTLTVMIRRIAQGHSPFLADKQHFHHKLLKIGLWHTEAVLAIYVIQAIFVISAFIFRFHSDWTLVIAYGLFSVLIITAFHIIERTGFKLQRHGVFDTVFKRRLRILRERGIFIQIVFVTIKFGLPVLLVITCFSPRIIPVNISVISAMLMILLLAAWLFKRNWLRRSLVLSLFVLIPVITYLSAEYTRLSGNSSFTIVLYNLSFLFLVFFTIMTLKLTKRRQGFRITTLDFLILLLALVAPFVAGTYIEHKEIGGIAAKMIILFFGYQVLLGELRDKIDGLVFATMSSLCVVVIRGFFGI